MKRYLSFMLLIFCFIISGNAFGANMGGGFCGAVNGGSAKNLQKLLNKKRLSSKEAVGLLDINTGHLFVLANSVKNGKVPKGYQSEVSERRRIERMLKGVIRGNSGKSGSSKSRKKYGKF